MADLKKFELPFVVVSFVALVTGMAALRIQTDGGFTITNTDVLVGVIPIAVWLVATGRIKEIAFGQFKLVASAISKAANKSVDEQVSDLPVSELSQVEKADPAEIERLRKQRKKALTFRLGHGGYAAPAIKAYFTGLACTLEYVVIEDENEHFFGILDFQILRTCLERSVEEMQSFAKGLNEADRNRIQALPSFVGHELAIHATQPKAQVLQKMESASVPILPVIDKETKRFAGIVERSRLVASMMLEITRRFEEEK